MAENYQRQFPEGTKRITTGCQYCAVGCGYNAFLIPENASVENGVPPMDGVSRFITPAMRNTIRFKGAVHEAAVAPDVRCDLNKGNHSVRGGSQGENLVTPAGKGKERSTRDRLKSPLVRLADGSLAEITWAQLNQIMARLIVNATGATTAPDNPDLIEIPEPNRLGVKLFEYQYLENTYALTKFFFNFIGTANVAYHDRPSVAGSSPGLADAGLRPHDFSYEEVRRSDLLIFVGTNPYENQSVFFMQYCVGKRMVVIDPRQSATAQYTVATGGIHLQPAVSGADGLLAYALAREILIRWKEQHGDLRRFPWRDRIVDSMNPPEPDWEDRLQGRKGTGSQSQAKRRESRLMNFDDFCDFLDLEGSESPYALERVAETTGLAPSDLRQLLDWMFDPRAAREGDQPRVGLFYEKGVIWGFNYHGTGALASLGLLLGAYAEPGRFVGRVGGHQKGWAAARYNLSHIVRRSPPLPPDSKDEGYPFRNGRDRYRDCYLKDPIPVHHNLDHHVFGPDIEPDEDQTGVAEGRTRFANGLETETEPDVSLLWIIGGNYFGQTNDCQTKRAKLEDRLKAGETDVARPESVADAVSVLSERMRNGGLVVVHQELFANPTSTYADLIIPAAGWGEDGYLRYNAQRRLKLLDRFQDMPLHPDDADIAGDPMDAIDQFEHSPKPDWRIVRDIANAVGDVVANERVAQRIGEAFRWSRTAQVADEMAEFSNRSVGLNFQQLLDFAVHRTGIPKGNGAIHAVMGAGRTDAEAPALREFYHLDNGQRTAGNGVASNGVILPVTFDPCSGILTGTARTSRPKGNSRLNFVRAPWHEVETAFNRVNQLPDGHVRVTNGRFNHLWNNLFHHVRNDYINLRYPADLPGPIVELNPDWAARQDIANGRIVAVDSGKDASDERGLRGVASLQDSVPDGWAFVLFSYPVKNGSGFEGYANNITDSYADAINPIAAVKFSTAKITPLFVEGGDQDPWFYRPSSAAAGPTYEPRNQIAAPGLLTGGRSSWEMREMIVTKGLPRAFVRREFKFRFPPHSITFPGSDRPREISGRFWRTANLTPEEFLNLKVRRERIADHLIDRLETDMPSGMLNPGTMRQSPLSKRLIDRARELMSAPDQFGAAELAEIQDILDTLIDLPHRAVADLFLEPDRFLHAMEEPDHPALRDRFAARLAPGDRIMLWEEDGRIIDEWHPEELEIIHRWYGQFQDP